MPRFEYCADCRAPSNGRFHCETCQKYRLDAVDRVKAGEDLRMVQREVARRKVKLRRLAAALGCKLALNPDSTEGEGNG